MGCASCFDLKPERKSIDMKWKTCCDTIYSFYVCLSKFTTVTPIIFCVCYPLPSPVCYRRICDCI